MCAASVTRAPGLLHPRVTKPARLNMHSTVPQVYRLITDDSVDVNIYELSQRKLRMDSAVLDGITTGKGGKADETQQMGHILFSLLTHKKDGEEGVPAVANGSAP